MYKKYYTNSKGEQFFDPNKLNDALQNNDFTTISEYLKQNPRKRIRTKKYGR